MTPRVLHLAKDLSLPLDAVTETFAILGRRGSGKTHTAVVMAEEMLAAGVPVVIIDPLDVWWGLRVSKDGKKAGFPIYVCGGSHQDVPLSADAGRILADVVVDRAVSMVLSLRHLSKTDQRRFVGEFCERLYDRKADPAHRTALHVFIDEADAFVPQRLVPGTERCFGAVDTLVRRGRSSGLAPTLISQRPQVINKDVLSQTEVLVAHQLTGPQDRKALETWIEANDTDNRQREFMASLASLQKGDTWFWSPGMLGIFTRVHVRDRQTFDSSATPKPGVQVAAPKAFAAVDLAQLTAEIAATIEKAKADDPKELRRQIADLKRQVAERPAQPTPTAEPICQPVLTDADRELLQKVSEQLYTAVAVAQHRWADELSGFLENLREEINIAAGVVATEREKMQKAVTAIIDGKALKRVLDKLTAVSTDKPRADYSKSITNRERSTPHSSTQRAEPTRVASGTRQSASPASAGPGDPSVGKAGLRRMLIALAQRQAGLTRRQLGLRAQVSAKGGSFDTISVTGGTMAVNERTNEASARPKPARRSLPKTAATPSPDDQAAVIAALRKVGHPMTPKDLAAALKVNRLRIPKLVDPMAAQGLVILTGVRRGRRIALAPQKAIAPAPRADQGLEKVWDGTKGSPSLTGSADGLGSSLSGVSYEVGRRGR